MRIRGLIILDLAACLMLSCVRHADPVMVDDYPPIFPDYCDVTVPSGIAPLNFCIPGEKISVSVQTAEGTELLRSRGKEARFPIRKWHKALSHSQLYVKVSTSTKEYRPFRISVSDDAIDYGLTYRLIPPGYQGFGCMSICERRLSDYKERVLIHNKGIDGGCLNCHTSFRTDPSAYSIHIRGDHSATLLFKDGSTSLLTTKTDATRGSFVYPSWSADGRYIAYSTNSTRQEFYSMAPRRVEVYDEESDIVVYDTEQNAVMISPLLSSESRFETHPAFSADGKTLYFCSCEAARMPDQYPETHYDLFSIEVDGEDGFFGDKVRKVVNADSLGLSLAMPRASYDGRFILVTACDFGTFPIWHKEADLYLYEMESGTFRPAAELNSDDTDSFHNWSSNSRWIVFSSRRQDGLYTRLYISHIDEDGNCTKPFMLPQRRPLRYYSILPFSYNTPDFCSSKANLPSRGVYHSIKSPARKQVESL